MALSASRDLSHYVDQELRTYKVKGSTTIYKGALVGLSSGYARGLVAADKFVGIAYEEVVNAGADGAKEIRVYTLGDFEHALSGVAQSNVSSAVYSSDDGTLTLTASGNSFVGILIGVPASGVALVRIDPAHSAL